MFNRLKKKWGVNAWQLLLILVTFALGGSLCGYMGRELLELTGIRNPVWRVPLYILLVTLLWPICVLVISIFFGQFPFFRNYLHKIFKRFGGK